MSKKTDSNFPPTDQPARGHDVLEARDLVAGESKRKADLAELKATRKAELDTLVAFCDEAIARMERQARKRQRKPSFETRVKALIKAGREPVIKPDGTIAALRPNAAVIGLSGHQAGNGVDINTWDEIL